MGGNRVFLFTDIEESTRLWERAPDRMGAVIARHDALLRETIAVHGGRVFKTLGDGICAVFDEPAAALAAALAVQRRVAAEPWAVEPFAVRVSVHAGPVEERDGDFFGTTLNRTARLMDLAHGGQILLSANVDAGALPEGARLRDLGEQRLRDLAEPERVHQLVHPDLPAEFAPLRSLDASPHNLPLQFTAFLGRERELEQIEGMLRGARLTTLVGTGGAGKTRLALHAAAEALPRFDAGAWLVELADLADGALIDRAVAFALQMRPEEEVPLLQQLAERIADRNLLLVLDNCEHVLDDAARVADGLLRRCANLRILATSRAPLRTAGEAVYPVEPLAEAQACALFLELAGAANFDFAVDDEGERRVASICRALDGIPLAIELAAACARRLDLAAIERGLAHRFDLLNRGSRTAQPHHRTLEAAIDWSYGMLEPDEQALLRRLSVFSGGWTRKSLPAVLGEGQAPAHDRLVDHSLVERRGDRYRFLESVRAFAAERLADDADEVQGRHAGFVDELVARSSRDLYTGDARAVGDEVEAEIDNIRAALGWMLKTPDRFEDGLRTAASFWVFCWMRGYMPEGRRWIERFLESGEASVGVRGQAHYAAGVLAKEQGDFPGARTHYEAALELHRRESIGDMLHANTLTALANVLRVERDFGRAQALYEESIELHRELGNARSVAGGLLGLGRVAQLRDDLATACDRYREALAIFREHGDQRGEIVSLSSLGEALQNAGQGSDAYRILREGLRLSRRQGDRHQTAGLLHHLAQIVRERGNSSRARRILRHSLATSWQHGSLFAVYSCLGDLANLEPDRRRRETLLGVTFALGQKYGRDLETVDSPDFEAGRTLDLDAAVDLALDRAP